MSYSTKIQKYLDDNIVVKQTDETSGLTLFKYAKDCQYENVWDEITMNSRGHVYDKDMNIVARPFSKFFNYKEQPELSYIGETYKVYPKLDGSLGIIYWYDGNWKLNSSGSFSSEQAIRGEAMLHDTIDVSKLDKNYTYVVEIIYPENRIVVNYGTDEKLVLLGKIRTIDGIEEYPENVSEWSGEKCFPLSNDITIDEILELDEENEEGYIVVSETESGVFHRVKFKFPTYCNKHYALSQLYESKLFEQFSKFVNSQYTNEVSVTQSSLSECPDEFIKYMYKSTDLDEEYVIKIKELLDVWCDAMNERMMYIANLVINTFNTMVIKSDSDLQFDHEKRKSALHKKIKDVKQCKLSRTEKSLIVKLLSSVPKRDFHTAMSVINNRNTMLIGNLLSYVEDCHVNRHSRITF